MATGPIVERYDTNPYPEKWRAMGWADGDETRRMTRVITDTKGPVYVRINRNDMPDVMPERQEFEIGKAYLLKDGRDVVIFAMGHMVSKALQTAEDLEKEGLSARVVNVSTLKPVRDEEIQKFAAGMKGIVTVEEHSLIGGLAGVVTYHLRGYGIPIETIGIEDRFGQSALNYDDLLEEYRLTPTHIARAVRKSLGMEGRQNRTKPG